MEIIIYYQLYFLFHRKKDKNDSACKTKSKTQSLANSTTTYATATLSVDLIKNLSNETNVPSTSARFQNRLNLNQEKSFIEDADKFLESESLNNASEKETSTYFQKEVLSNLQ